MDTEVTIFKGESEKIFLDKCSVNNLRIINLTLFRVRPVLLKSILLGSDILLKNLSVTF